MPDTLADLPGLSVGDRRRLRRAGLRSPRDLRALARTAGWDRVPVPASTRAFLRWRPRRFLPRADASAVAITLKRAVRIRWGSAPARRPDHVDTVGGVRRGIARSKDVDLLLTDRNVRSFGRSGKAKPVGRSRPTVSLAGRTARILEVYAAGRRRVSAIVRVALPRGKTRARSVTVRTDFFLGAPAERPFALLHFTGPWIYNVRLRAHARRQRIKLNQYGAWRGDRNVGAGVRSERGVARLLGFTFRPPETR